MTATAALRSPSEAERLTRPITFVFTDIVGSTEKLTLLGEAAWLKALSDHNYVVQDVVDAYGGNAHKFLGDGWMVTFASPRDGIDSAVAIQFSEFFFRNSPIATFGRPLNQSPPWAADSVSSLAVIVPCSEVIWSPYATRVVVRILVDGVLFLGPREKFRLPRGRVSRIDDNVVVVF